MSANDRCAEDQRNNAEPKILVDTGQAFGLDDEAGFFLYLPPNSVGNRLVQFEYPAGNLPVSIVSSLHDEHPAAIDGIAVIGMVMRGAAFSRDTRRLGFRVQVAAGVLSLACNAFAGSTVGERVYGVLIVALFVFSEWLSDRIEGREVDEQREQAVKRAAAVAKGKATRAANKAATEQLVKSGKRRMGRELAKLAG